MTKATGSYKLESHSWREAVVSCSEGGCPVPATASPELTLAEPAHRGLEEPLHRGSRGTSHQPLLLPPPGRAEVLSLAVWWGIRGSR